MPAKRYKGRLDVKDAHMILSGLDYSFRTPVDHYKINIKNTASVIINVISMGNMLGL